MEFSAVPSKGKNYFKFVSEKLPGTLQDTWEYSEFRLLGLVPLVQRRLDLYLVCFCAYFINTGVLRQNNNSVKMDQPQWRQIHGSAF